MARSADIYDDVSHNQCSTKQGGGGHDGGTGQQCGPSEGAVVSYGSWLKHQFSPLPELAPSDTRRSTAGEKKMSYSSVQNAS
uniref:Uncharacterized protein n=1 Tax=Oryza glaberrima TaxID=4538 RepID=I1QL06_ORYGL